MTLTLLEIFLILIIHWIADFWLQSDSMAKGKSKNWKDLLHHTFIYSLVFMWSSAFKRHKGYLFCFNYIRSTYSNRLFYKQIKF